MDTRILAPGDADYPELLAPSPLSPCSSDATFLYVRGELPRAPGLAIVGTRRPSDGAEPFTQMLACEAAAAGCSIWSGGAKGIDTAAHRAALRAGAATAAVLAGGLDQPAYPPDNAELFEQILEAGGALVSMHPDGTRRANYHFPQRNKLLAGLTFATLVVERPRVSGAGYTTRAARRLGRDVIAVPSAPWSRSGAGYEIELRHGARIVWSPDELGRYLAQRLPQIQRGLQLPLPLGHLPPGRGDSAHRTAPALDEVALRVLAAVDTELRHVDAVCDATALTMPVVADALLTLVLEGLVLELSPGHFVRSDGGGAK